MISSRSTTWKLIDQITSQLLIYKYVSNVKTNTITTKVQKGTYQQTVTKVNQRIYVFMNGCKTLPNLFTTNTEEGCSILCVFSPS